MVLQRGHFVEIRRGPHVLVGQIRWATGECCGAHADTVLNVNTLKSFTPSKRAYPSNERRARRRRVEETEDVVRWLSRLIEFSSLGIVGLIAAVMAAQIVDSALAAPMKQVRAHLLIGANDNPAALDGSPEK